MRRSILAIPIILVLTPACKEETPKQQPAAKVVPLSYHGKQIVKLYDKILENDRKAIKTLKAAKRLLESNPSDQKTISKAMQLHSKVLGYVFNDNNIAGRIDKLWVKARKNKTLNRTDMLTMQKKSEAWKALSPVVVALSKEFMASVRKAQLANNKKLKARLHKLQKQLSK